MCVSENISWLKEYINSHQTWYTYNRNIRKLVPSLTNPVMNSWFWIAHLVCEWALSLLKNGFHRHMGSYQGGDLNIKISSYQYRNFHCKDKTVSRLSYFYNGNSHTLKDHLYIETGPWFHQRNATCLLSIRKSLVSASPLKSTTNMNGWMYGWVDAFP